MPVQDNFLTQHVLEPTRAERVLYIVLSSQKEFVDNVVIQEPLGSSDHNQLHFNINIKSDKTKVKLQCRRDFRRGNYEEIRKRLALIDGNDKMNKGSFTIMTFMKAYTAYARGRGSGTTVRFPPENQHLFLITDNVL